MVVDYYEILDTPFNSTEDDIKIAFRKQVIEWHTNKYIGKDLTTWTQLVKEAYLILRDKEAREKYDSVYKMFKTYSETHRVILNKENGFTYDRYIIHYDK